MRKRIICGILTVFIVAVQLLCVYAEGELRITTVSLPSGETGKEYTAQLSAEGGDGDYTFSLAKGRLPDGVILEENGLIHGMPRSSGYFIGLTFCVSDGTGASVTAKIKLKITSIPVDFTITDNSYEYDGQEHTATVTPSVAELTEGVDFVVTYGGRLSQSNAGSYNISIVMNNLRYRVRNVTGTYLAITTAPAALRASSKTVVYDGERHGIDVVAEPEDLPYTVTYRGRGDTAYGPSTNPPFAIGTYTVTVQPDRNYDVQSVTVNLTITDPREDVVVDFTVSNQVQEYIPGQETQVYSPVITPSHKDFTGYTVSYRKTDTEGAEPVSAVTEAGNYEIVIDVFEEWHKLGTVTGDQGLGSRFVLNPYEVSFTVTNNRHARDGNLKTATVTPSLEGFNDYAVFYGSGDAASSEGQSELGEYDITIVLTNPNYILNSQPEKKLIIAEELQAVNFTVTNNIVTYNPQQAEYEATVIPSLDGFSGYLVQYQNSAGEITDKITAVGTYAVLIEITESGYEKGGVSEGGDSFQLLPMQITFSVSNYERYATGTELIATVLPPEGFREKYSVIYDNIATAEVEQNLSAKDVGEYRILIQIDNSNYIAAEVSQRFRILDPIVLNYGNSPYGLIMQMGWTDEQKEQAKQAFSGSYQFAEGLIPENGNAQIVYSAAAWTDNNLDLDDAAVFVYDLSQLQDPGCLAHYTDGSVVPQEEITVNLNGVSGAQKHKSGVYGLEYSFTDKLTRQKVSKTRSVVLLGRIGDANSDGNVNAVDSNYIKNGGIDTMVSESMSAADRLHLYRICDVNKDGVVDDGDSNAISNRFVLPLVPYYK